MAYQRHKKPNKKWLAFEHWCFKYKHIFWLAVWFLIFFVMPFIGYDHIDIMDLP